MTDAAPNPRLRFHRRSRMRSKNDFTRLFATALRARGREFSVAITPNGLGYTRLGLSVGKRCWRGAVGRNRVRRVFREAFRLSLPDLPVGYDVLMIATQPRLVPRLEAVRNDLVRLTHEAVARGAGKR
ncbi:MAG: ribonuclease P protein component [Planctomycetota bacterium]